MIFTTMLTSVARCFDRYSPTNKSSYQLTLTTPFLTFSMNKRVHFRSQNCCISRNEHIQLRTKIKINKQRDDKTFMSRPLHTVALRPQITQEGKGGRTSILTLVQFCPRRCGLVWESSYCRDSTDFAEAGLRGQWSSYLPKLCIS